MRAEVVSMDAKHPDKEAIKRAGQILQNGGLVAFPTETVYGLGGNALDPRASMKIYAAKGRPSDNPLIIHIADMSSLPKIVSEIPAKAQLLAAKFWPGPLTMILPKAELVTGETTGGLDSVAVRFPSDLIAQELIKAAGGFVAAPSANTSGRPSPTRAENVEEDLGDAIDMKMCIRDSRCTDLNYNVFDKEERDTDYIEKPEKILEEEEKRKKNTTG